MKKKILTTLSLGALLVLGACGDDANDTPPTKAEACAAGLSEACLMGTWQVDGPTEVNIIEGIKIEGISKSHDFTADPAKLRFYYDEDLKQNTFEFTWSPLSTATYKDGITYGTWSITGNQLSLTTTVGNTSFAVKSATILPVIQNTGSRIEMNFGKLFFLAPEMVGEDNLLQQNDFEVFYISANATAP